MPRTEPPTTQPPVTVQPGAGQPTTDGQPSPQSAIDATNPPKSLARSALLLSIGNIASRVLGLAREMVIARTFDDALVGAFTIASQVPTLLYDFLIGGMLSAALVPILSEYAHRDRAEFAKVVSLLLTIFGTLLLILTGLLYLAAPQVAWLLCVPAEDAMMNSRCREQGLHVVVYAEGTTRGNAQTFYCRWCIRSLHQVREEHLPLWRAVCH